MITISIIGLMLVLVGLILTIPTIGTRMALGRTIGWALASVGMFLLFLYHIISGNIVFGIITLIFAIGNIFFCIECFKEYNKWNGNNN